MTDKDWKSNIFKRSCLPKEKQKEIQEILGMETGEIQDDIHRFNIEMSQKLHRYENQPKPKKNDREESK